MRTPVGDNYGADVPSSGDILKFKIRQVITRQFKAYLYLLEELVDDHDAALVKLVEALPTEYKGYVNLADYLPEHRVESNRRRVLDDGNAAVRELEELIDNLRIE